jgi:glutamyl-tRNA synthetase
MNRLRFAPSPTGALHIGGIRTALYNYLLARQKGGKFILRIEDTDKTRYVPGAEEYIIRALNWLGLTPDEGPAQGGPFAPYKQSERMHIYRDFALQLVKSGKAYYAWDTAEDLEHMRQRLAEKGVTTSKYDASVRGEMKNSLALAPAEVDKLLVDVAPYTIRLKVDPGQAIIIHDKIRGEVTFDSGELDDKVLLKTDGYPTYHLANVVDDHLMEITDVIRGEEWLPSTAHHVLLYRAFGWEDTMPTFSHLPLILKPDGHGKLSKRDGQKFGFPVFPLAWPSDNPEESIDGFDSYGFEPEAVINFLAFLGWNPGTEQEIFSLDELISVFDPERIHKGGARFDYDKALWFNQQYVQQLSFEAAEPRLRRYAEEAGYNLQGCDLEAVYNLLKARVHRLIEVVPQGYYFFTDALVFDEAEINKKWIPDVAAVLLNISSSLQSLETFNHETAAATAKEIISASGIKMGVIMPLLRASLTGTTQGPDVFAIAEVLGKDKTVIRMKQMAERNYLPPAS